MEVFYTPKAKETAQLVWDFLVEKWGIDVANDFVKKADRLILLISSQPFMFKASEIDLNLRVATITRQTSLIYEVRYNKIILLFFYDNRQDPIIG